MGQSKKYDENFSASSVADVHDRLDNLHLLAHLVLKGTHRHEAGHILVGDGIGTNHASAKIVWWCVAEQPLGPGVTYFLRSFPETPSLRLWRPKVSITRIL